MAYQSNKPQGADALSQSQGDILNNFISIKALVDINHETFDIPQKGKHTQVDLTDQTAAPPTSAADEVTLYSNAGDLCLSKDGGAEINFTTVTDDGTDGYTLLPSGLILDWGRFTLTAGAGAGKTFQAVTLKQPMTTIYSLQYSAFNNNATNPQHLTFTYVPSGGPPYTTVTFTRGAAAVSVIFHYFIIGV